MQPQRDQKAAPWWTISTQHTAKVWGTVRCRGNYISISDITVPGKEYVWNHTIRSRITGWNPDPIEINRSFATDFKEARISPLVFLYKCLKLFFIQGRGIWNMIHIYVTWEKSAGTDPSLWWVALLQGWNWPIMFSSADLRTHYHSQLNYPNVSKMQVNFLIINIPCLLTTEQLPDFCHEVLFQ